jgi:hypothetical protein
MLEMHGCVGPNLFHKKVIFSLNIPAEFGIIQTAIEMAGI